MCNETRPGAKKVLFLITDGNYNEGGSPESNAKLLREKKGFQIYTIGIGKVDRSGLEKIASLPFPRHIYMLKDFSMLETLKKLVNRSSVG